jgi:peptidoglycan/LPS O-acetylase OafA/YrhL
MLIYSITLYIIFFLTLICLFRQKIPSQTVTLMLTAVLLFCIIDKVGVGWPSRNVLPATGDDAIWTLFMRIGLFALPIIAAGTSRNEKSRIWGILAGLTGGLYMLVRGILEMGLLVSGPRG